MKVVSSKVGASLDVVGEERERGWDIYSEQVLMVLEVLTTVAVPKFGFSFSALSHQNQTSRRWLQISCEDLDVVCTLVRSSKDLLSDWLTLKKQYGWAS